MIKLINIDKLTDNEFLNLYKLTYKNKHNTHYYYVASRRDINKLECLKHKVDAVRAVPYIYKDNKLYVVIIKEFRYAVRDYIYGIPAGLIDNNESYENAIKRELQEEIGASVVSLEKASNACYTSAGLTDESCVCFYAKVELVNSQKLDENEDITFELVEFDNILEFIKNNKFGLQSALLLQNFYYENKLKILENEICLNQK